MSDRQEFARFAELMPEAMLLVDGTGHIHAVNNHLTTMLGGYPAEELEERSLLDLAADPPDQVLTWLRTCSRSRELMPGSLNLPCRNGDRATFRAGGAVYRPAADGNPPVILARLTPRAAAVDPFLALNLRIEELTAQVSRRRRAEQALHAEREWLRVTLESIGDAVIATDHQGHITFLNPVASTLTGWSQEEAQGRPLKEIFVLFNEYTFEPVESPVTRVLREGVTVGLANHTILVARDGTHYPIDDSGAPIRDEHGELIGVVLVFHDVTERRELERELETRNRNLVEADRRKDEFLAMLAHELRNPLAPLRSGTDILRMAGGDARRVDQVAGMMDRQVRHLTRLVDDLLDVSRITRGRIELHRQRVSIQSILSHALELVSQQMLDRAHHVSTSLPDAPVYVYGDATRLSQVFSNLLANAAKFTDPGGAIDLSVETAGDSFAVRVRDSGIGIDPDRLDDIFELFTQAESSLERSVGGLGLGLTVAKQVVEMHGGTISASSPGRGGGSEFEVVLPLAESAVADAGSAPSAGSDGKGSLRVLVVDDNRDAADALAMLARLWGHEPRIAADGVQALDACASFRPDVVLLDLGLPGLDGFQVARRLRQDPAFGDVRLIAVTGFGRDEDRRLAAESGFDDHLTKPVDPQHLARLLEELGS